MAFKKNTLYYGDNLLILKELSKSQPFIDLIYIDPPFNSKRNYNLLYEDLIQNQQNEEKTTALKEAFSDTWSNVELSHELEEMKDFSNLNLYHFLTNNRNIFSDAQSSYLTMMAHRIYYMHKILKDTGSFYLHCDPTMSHYLKILCDIVFGRNNFKNQITWKRYATHSLSKKEYNNITDIIFFYSKQEDNNYFSPQYSTLNEDEIEARFPYVEKETGRRYQHATLEKNSNSYSKNETRTINDKVLTTKLGWIWTQKTFDERLKKNPYLIHWTKKDRPRYKIYQNEYRGKPLGNIWIDIPYLSSGDRERLGYPTQKPEALLERIILASSNEGDIVADFFCGCGTTITVAEKLKRKWIGVDISHLAVGLVEDKRLKKSNANYQTIGFPNDRAQVEKLAKEKPFEFEQWIVEYQFKGHSTRKTGDGGYDGHIAFADGNVKKICLIEVKGGQCNIKNLREFINVVDKQKADLGIFICFEKQITKPMKKECDESGFIDIENMPLFKNVIPKISIITIEDLLANDMPPWINQLLFNITY